MKTVGPFNRRDFLKMSSGAAFAISAAGILDACGFGSSSQPAATTKLKGKIATQEFDNASTPSVLAEKALVAIGGALGLPTTELVFNFDDAKEIAQIAQLKLLGVNAFESLILDSAIAREIALACVTQGIYIGAWAQLGPWLVPSEPAINFHYQGIGTPAQGAYALCKEMFTAIGGTGNFVFIDATHASSTVVGKDRAVARALAEFPGINLVAQQDGGANRAASQKLLNTILVAHPKVDVVYCINDDSALGALAALRDRGLAGKVLLSGADAIPEAVDEVIAGNMFGTEAPSVPWGAGYCLIQALDAANGYRPNPLESIMICDLLLLDTKEAAASFKSIQSQPNWGIDFAKLSHVLHPDDWDPQWPLIALNPDHYWADERGIAKPAGYSLPSDWTDAVAKGGYQQVNSKYADHLKNFPYTDTIKKSRTGQTALQSAGLRP